MADALIKTPDDSANTGKALDNSALTRDDGTVAYRQRVVFGDGADAGAAGLAEVTGRRLGVRDETLLDVAKDIRSLLQSVFLMLSQTSGEPAAGYQTAEEIDTEG